MYPNQQVTELRKSGRLEQALQVGREALQNRPDDVWLKRAVAWVYYDFVKKAAEQISRAEGNLPAGRKNQLVAEVRNYSREYAKLKLERPDMSASQMMRIISTVGRYLDFFPGWCSWFGVAGFSTEDLQPYETEKGSASCMLTKVARELCAWRDQPANHDGTHDELIFEFIEAALANPQEPEENKIWLQRDNAKLLLQVGDIVQAKAEMQKFIKHKSREFWVWRDLADIERAANSGLELACLCQALLCKAPDNFLVKTRIALATAFAGHGEYACAVYECLKTAEVYQREGWPFPEQLEALMQSPWFDPEQSNTNQQALYEQHAAKAKLLAYDNVRQEKATFLDGFTVGKNNQLKALFAVRKDNKTLQILADAPWPEEGQPKRGSPYSLMLGEDAKGERVLSIERRPEGTDWDSVGQVAAVIDHLNPAKRTGSFFISSSSYALIPHDFYEEAARLGLGHPVSLRVAYNTPKQRYEAWQMQPVKDIEESSSIKTVAGVLDVHENGFAFCDDIFVQPALVRKVNELQPVEMLCVYKKKPNKSEYGWTALTIKQAEQKQSMKQEPEPASGIEYVSFDDDCFF